VWILIGVGAFCCLLLIIGVIVLLSRRQRDDDDDDWRGASALVMSERPGDSLKENASLTAVDDDHYQPLALDADDHDGDETLELQRQRAATEKSVPAGSYTTDIDDDMGAYGGAGFDVQDKVNY
jgi:hypothetical protein